MQLTTYSPSEQILKERHALAEAFSALRRVRPRVPFWQLAAHRIPTLWSLYRGLQKEAPGDELRWRCRLYFERFRSLTSPSQTRHHLLYAHKLLDAFRSANEGDIKMRGILSRYESLIAVKREKARMSSKICKELAWQERLWNRPILTGSSMRPSIANGPLPRMKPQPEHITMMIRRRRFAYERHSTRFSELKNVQNDLDQERRFENRLVLESMAKSTHFESEFASEEWDQGIKDHRALLKDSLTLARTRAVTPLSGEMLAVIEQARRHKARNKIREKERERKGELLTSTLRARRKMPPAHILDRMSDADRKRDRARRSANAVGR